MEKRILECWWVRQERQLVRTWEVRRECKEGGRDSSNPAASCFISGNGSAKAFASMALIVSAPTDHFEAISRVNLTSVSRISSTFSVLSRILMACRTVSVGNSGNF